VLPVVVAVTGMGVLTFSLIAPALPDLADALDVSRATIGLVQSAVAVPGIVLALFIGYLYDRRGRRFVAALSLLIFGAAGLVGFFARSFWPLVVVRAVQGIGTSGILSLGVIVIGDLFPAGHSRRRALGINSAGLTMTGMVAPIVGGSVAQLDPFAPFLVFGLAIPMAALGWRRLPGTAEDRPEAHPVRHVRGMAAQLGIGGRSADFGGLLLFGSFALIVFAGLGFTTTPLYLEAEFGLESAARGMLQALLAVGSTTASLSVARIAGRLGPRRTFNTGMVLISAGFVGLGSAPNLAAAGASLLSLGLGFGLSFPLVQDFVTSAVPGVFRGAAVGAFVMSVRIGQAVGPLLGSLAAETPGTRISYAVGAAVTLVFLITWQPARMLARRIAGE
jgi:ACDE family multidrug resistance protein